MDVATVEGNITLAVGVDRRIVERCKDAIEKLGVLHTPVVGLTQGGRRTVLSGQTELTAMKELGVRKMDAVEVEVPDDVGVMAKLALTLMSLRGVPDALGEGLLLQEAVDAGIPRSEIQAMLGKSASWVSNRLSLVTRLDCGVYEMVKAGLLDPRSAQEIARLPEKEQFAFADSALREGLPKSAIELLVAGYNDESCPDAVKTQIINNPKAALERMADRRRAISVHGSQPGHRQKNTQFDDIEKCIMAAKTHIAILYRALFNKSLSTTREYSDALKELEAELLALLAIIRGLVSPGKTEVGQDAG
jgi:ParB-like chromosome segregation protein Spo0J